MTIPRLRLIMIGTRDFALPTFDHLLRSGHEIALLVTQPERPQGRKQLLIPSRIKTAATAAGVPVFQPEDINAPEVLPQLAAYNADVLITVAYGQILSSNVLKTARLGGLNLHGSILPSYRGAAPVARAIQNGETKTGVTVIRMSPKIDAGGILAVAETPIDPFETAGMLEERLAELGGPLMAAMVDALAEGTATVIPQDKTRVTRAPKLTKEEGRIDWTQSAQKIHDHVRAMQPWPVAVTYYHPRTEGRLPVRLLIHQTRPHSEISNLEGRPPGAVLDYGTDRLVVVAGLGAVEILNLQTPGKQPQPTPVFLRGHPIFPGERLSHEILE